MKKLILAVIVILIAMFFVTCDEPIVEDDAIVEYTDVVYSPDGSEVTVYFDGVTVPVTKAQRAMNRDLAMMAYDFLEVIFVKGINVARTNWDLGQPAGININADIRDGTTNYGASIGSACLFAGKKSDKTLFGIGKLESGTIISGGSAPTRSVTFKISAILTGLLVGTETATITANVLSGNTRGVWYDSLTPHSTTNSKLTDPMGGVSYPLYDLGDSSTATFTYTFGIVQSNTGNWAAAIVADTPVAQRRTPRFLDGGAYREPKNLVNTKTTVSGAFSSVGAAFNPAVVLTFTTTATNVTGYFSVYLEIPVYMVNNTATLTSTSPVLINKADGGTEALTWYIRSGYGSELYSIDDGSSSGGCALFGKGTTGASDWLEIDWKWLPYTGS